MSDGLTRVMVLSDKQLFRLANRYRFAANLARELSSFL